MTTHGMTTSGACQSQVPALTGTTVKVGMTKAPDKVHKKWEDKLKKVDTALNKFTHGRSPQTTISCAHFYYLN